ncbi:MAG: hypothetical protein ABR927_18520 [Bacteroidales bacterium]|jgi:uncharacterized membrane protein
MKRIDSIDVTRGLVMVIMALDHVRDFMHSTSMSQSPTNLQTTTTFLLKTPSRIIGISGLLIIFCHNLLQGISIPSNPVVIFITSVLFHPFLMQPTQDFAFYTAYPLIPWLGIMMAGFACGEFFELPSEKRNKIFLKIGLSALLLFIIIRFINIYGDPSPWSEQKSALFTFLSFINTTKYPPSLLFDLLFLGIMLLMLFISEKVNNRFTGILSVYGRVPLFYFVIHLFIIHSLMFVMLFLQGFSSKDLLFGAFNNGRPKMGGGVELSVIYLIWAVVVALLYPVCKWYGIFKSEHRENQLLRYL